MATWITHSRIADMILNRGAELDLRGFCVGNIAPDCNVENEDWTSFTPPREVTHWMGAERKAEEDCERFYKIMIDGRSFRSEEERAFLLGYYSHLVTDAEFQKFLRDEQRLQQMFIRIRTNPALGKKVSGIPDDYDAIKRIFSKRERLRDIEAMEASYLKENPQSRYLTVIRPLRDFPDYIEYLPHGAIVRKIQVMGELPAYDLEEPEYVFFSKSEYMEFIDQTVEKIHAKITVSGA